ncbi:Na/Pi cotransporter [Geothermobacter hydrogeniphilus]|uniref:Na/Pi cotransporter n=1 Tax=Geothermobacter hydrogeniphilus TaxID=1969733 RepID=A0A2K2H682_9BACT|nr:Na/Pi cotransporter family protein [Geothermobacter hydrogeniphilus]PNU18750.1 Na/Pi cotransporter [Geothermobacter hydrogeniphilus]
MFELLLNRDLIFGLMGGLGLFLFGMKTMSEGLQKIAGNRMRKILSALTNNRIVGTLVGLAVTAIIQSSSATTVMVVGFVNAGLMSLVQSIGVVLGANIGTTITAQIIAFKVSYLALPAIGVGAGMRLFSRHRKWSYLGEIILGFGLLFFGMETMKHAFDPIKTSREFHQFFTLVGNNHLLGVLIGAVMTVVVQSSSATIGVTLALASSGLLSFEASMALILGENIGTTITANLAAIGTNLAARRTAFAHFLFNLIGVAYMLVLFPVFMHLVDKITPGDADFVIRTQQQAIDFGVAIGDKPFISRHIANTHTLFNIVNTLVFLPLIGLLAKLSTLCIRGREEEFEFHLKFIDCRVLNTPPIALGQARSETRRMAHVAMEMVDETLEFLRDHDLKRVPQLEKREELVDLLQREITDFLVALSQKSISQETSRQLASLMQMVSDLERIGDHCENLWRLGQKKIEQKVVFSETAIGDIDNIGNRCREFLQFVVSALEREDGSVLEKALYLEDRIDSLENQLRLGHISRLNTGECAVPQGLIFIDMLHNFEKIGDHTFNVAQAVAGKK